MCKNWGVIYIVIGFILIGIDGIIGFMLASLQDIVYYGWFAKWLPQQVKDRMEDKKAFSMMLKEFSKTYFLAGFSNKAPDPLFVPYLSILGPSAILMAAFLSSGAFITGLQSFQWTVVILIILVLIIPNCIYLAIWQLKKGRW
mgnify:CR=1 FL=1